MHIKSLFIIIVVLVLNGCLSSPGLVNLKQEDLIGHGVLTGIFVSNGWVADTGDVEIDGVKYKDAIKDGKILVKLPPGKYTLEKVSFHNYALMGYSTINRDFEIKSGHVTNLGRSFAYYKKASDKQYRLFFIKNTEETREWLKNNQAEIYPRIAKQELVYPEGNYISGNDLNNLRKMVAFSEIEKSKDRSIKIVSGQLGTLGRVVRNKSNQITDIWIIPTNTLNNIEFCSENRTRFACLIPDSSSLDLVSGLNYGRTKVDREKAPINSKNVKVVLYGDNVITLIDETINLYTSKDNGRTFVQDSRFKLSKPLEHFNHLEIHKYDSGFYLTVFSHNSEDRRMLYAPNRKSSGLDSIPLPDNNNPRDLYEANNHLLMGPYPGAMSSEVYIKKLDSHVWSTVTIPSGSCYKLFVVNAQKDHLKVKCGTGKSTYYLSLDGGLNWKSI